MTAGWAGLKVSGRKYAASGVGPMMCLCFWKRKLFNTRAHAKKAEQRDSEKENGTEEAGDRTK